MNAVAQKTLRKDRETQAERATAYEFHFNNRLQIKAMSEEMQSAYKEASKKVPTAHLDWFGNDTYTTADWNTIMQEAARNKLLPRLVNPWYTSDEAWTTFQELWQKLDNCG